MNYDDDESIESENDDEFDEAAFNKQKLDAIYQFIHAMPEVFEPVPAVGGKRKRS